MVWVALAGPGGDLTGAVIDLMKRAERAAQDGPLPPGLGRTF
jgi:hypothetical protein